MNKKPASRFNERISCLSGAKEFFMRFFEKSGIHGFFYFSSEWLTIAEKYILFQ